MQALVDFAIDALWGWGPVGALVSVSAAEADRVICSGDVPLIVAATLPGWVCGSTLGAATLCARNRRISWRWVIAAYAVGALCSVAAELAPASRVRLWPRWAQANLALFLFALATATMTLVRVHCITNR